MGDRVCLPDTESASTYLHRRARLDDALEVLADRPAAAHDRGEGCWPDGRLDHEEAFERREVALLQGVRVLLEPGAKDLDAACRGRTVHTLTVRDAWMPRCPTVGSVAGQAAGVDVHACLGGQELPAVAA